MAAEERSQTDTFRSPLYDRRFGATGVCYETVRARKRAELLERFEDAIDGLRQVNDVGFSGGFFQRYGALDGSRTQAGFDGPWRTHTQQLTFETGLAQS
jgi:hypothetical protein